jgi:hypothetical protein
MQFKLQYRVARSQAMIVSSTILKLLSSVAEFVRTNGDNPYCFSAFTLVAEVWAAVSRSLGIPLP